MVFYEFKVKQFLMALALGMRPAKIYTGQDSAVEGILFDGWEWGSSFAITSQRNRLWRTSCS